MQGAKQRISINLIARAIQITATVIAAEVIAERLNGAAVVDDAMSDRAHLEDGVLYI